MRRRLILWCAALLTVGFLLGCSGKKPVATQPPPPAPPATAPGPPAPPAAAPGQPPAAGRAPLPPAPPGTAPQPPAAKPKEVTIELRPDPNNPGRMIPVAPGASAPAGRPAPPPPTPPVKLNLATAEEKALGIPFYPGATREGGVEAKTGEARYDKHIVLYTADSPQKVEAFYRRQFPGASVIGSGTVGDQSFTNLRLDGAGKTEKRAFFFVPSGSKKTKLELTVGTGN